jgi:HEAT repeat protein
LGKMGSSAVEALLSVLKDEDSRVRENAVAAIGRIKDTRAVDPLIDAMKDEDPRVRRNVAWALGHIAAPFD